MLEGFLCVVLTESRKKKRGCNKVLGFGDALFLGVIDEPRKVWK